MTRTGRLNELVLQELTPGGALLEGGIPLPAAEVPAGSRPGDRLQVFLYHDFADRLVATTAPVAAAVGEVGWLKIVATNDAGAFLHWGLPKDLLLPWSEVKPQQKRLVTVGRKLLVYVFLAEDGRIAASARLDEFLSDEADDLKEGDRVTVIVADPTDLGVRVVVDHKYWGLVHTSDVFKTVSRGQRQDGYVKTLRPDRKLDIALSAPGYGKVEAAAEGILKVLARRGGSLAVGDKTPPEEIYTLFGISKKVFKQALGALYRSRRITLDDAGVHLAPLAPGLASGRAGHQQP